MLKERTAELTAAGLWEQVDDKTGNGFGCQPAP
jgi:hypothetical protein